MEKATQGDYGIPFYFVLLEEDGVTPFNLTGATVVLTIASSSVTLTVACTVTDAANGKCQYAFTSGDATTLVAGTYKLICTASNGVYNESTFDQGDLLIVPKI